MKNKFLLTALFLMAYMQSMAQADISGYYLNNHGFDKAFNYGTDRSGNIAGDVVNNVEGWDNETTATYTVAGTFAYNPNLTFNNSSALPASGHEASAGGALGLTTGWGMQLLYSQTVTLPKGTYRLKSAYYNVGTATAGTSLLAWIPGSGTTVKSTVNSFPVQTWKTDEITFTLTAKTTGKIQIGLATSGSAGSGNQAKLLVDYVKLLCDNMDNSQLTSLINTATNLYGDGSGAYAAELHAALTEAQRVKGLEQPDIIALIEATQALDTAIDTYKYKNASPEDPLNMTRLITNASFESTPSDQGWENKGMSAQNNITFTAKSGSIYMEKWVNIGEKVADASLRQVLKDVPNGHYYMTVGCSNIQQKSTGSTLNVNDTPQTGVSIYAGIYSIPVDTMKKKTLDFIVLDGEVEIGFQAKNATGNWIACDNFRLYYTGEANQDSHAAYLQTYISHVRKEILTLKMQDSYRKEIETRISEAETAIKSENRTEASLTEARQALKTAVEASTASTLLYDNLEKELVHAEKVLGWYKDDAEKAGKMNTAISTAQAVTNNFALTTNELNQAIQDLNSVTESVDKKIYTAQWSMGDINNPNNAWSITRTRESKNWVLFWEKDYGENPSSFTCGGNTVNIDEVLAHADKAFDFYTDSLKYIKRETSKTNTYKMVIRLRYSTEWEATGSGVDDLIGLLTLTPWAASSRNWQTLYHEIGHCFQYQTHCDNGDWNGWMYAIGNGTAFWEQCAQWQAYKIMPEAQFNNEWYQGYLDNAHKHILHESPRYNNYFVMDYWSYLHGMDFMGKLWNQCINPEDAVEAYMRITGINLNQFNDEMYDCAARFATWDIPHLIKYGNTAYNRRAQPAMTKLEDGAWRINAEVTPENTGYNIIKLNCPTEATTVSAYFEGIAGTEGYRLYNKRYAGWRYGFVALQKDGTRVYGDMGRDASYRNPTDTIHFNCPDNCTSLYFVVTGAPTRYWQHLWDDDDSNDEQWPYQVKFNNTNRYGTANLTAISSTMTTQAEITVNGNTVHILPEEDARYTIYNLSGNLITQNEVNTTGCRITLNSGFYIVKVIDKNDRMLTTKKVIIR